MIDGSLLATIAASAGIVVAGVGAVGVIAYLTLPKPEDEFERSMAELLELTTASGVSPQRPRRAACANTSDDHQLDSGMRMTVESSESPPPIASCRGRVGHGAAGTDGLAAVQSSESVPFLHSIEGSGDSVPVQRDRPALFLVSK